MKTLNWRAVCIVGALAMFVSFPRVSAAFDCSFGGVINPPLPNDGDECIASGAVTAKGDLVVDTASTSEFDIEGGVTLRVKRPGPDNVASGSLYVAEYAELDGGCDEYPTDVTKAVLIDVADDIDSDGDFEICNARQGVTVRTANGNLVLHGDETDLEGSQVKLSSDKGNVVLDGAFILSFKGTVDVAAPKGFVVVSNSILIGTTCRITGHFVDGGGNFFLCNLVAQP